MEQQVATFNLDDLQRAMVEFVPATVVPLGKNSTERRMHVVTTGSPSTQLFACVMGGKVGKAAREGVRDQAIQQAAFAASRGNYKPLAEKLAIVQGEAVFISNRASYESLADRYEAKIADLKAMGKYFRKGNEDKLSAKASAMEQCLHLVKTVEECVEAIVAQRAQRDNEHETN